MILFEPLRATIPGVMCIFTGPVQVAGTRIFARVDGEEQLLAYQMEFAAAGDLADGRHEPGGEIAVPGDERARVRLGLTHRLPPGTA